MSPVVSTGKFKPEFAHGSWRAIGARVVDIAWRSRNRDSSAAGRCGWNKHDGLPVCVRTAEIHKGLLHVAAAPSVL